MVSCCNEKETFWKGDGGDDNTAITVCVPIVILDMFL